MGGLSPTIKIQTVHQFVILSFGVDPLNWQSFIEIGEIPCSTPACCTHGLTLKMSKSGQKQSQTKGRSNLPPPDTGSESNLIMFCRLQIGYVWTEVIRKKKLRFQMKTDTCEQRLNT